MNTPTVRNVCGNVPSSETPAISALLAELGRRWRAGEKPLVEELLARHPTLQDRSSVVLKLIQEEHRLRHECGAVVPSEEYLRRFPRWVEPLQVLLSHEPT